MDDVGASSKRYEVYARPLPLPGRARHAGDILFLKYLPALRAWGPYRELSAADWQRIGEILERTAAVLTVAVTAGWVEWSGRIVPYPERFPHAAEILRGLVATGRIEVANHGLTHCVLRDLAFRPRVFAGNRRWHREFYDWIPLATQREHLTRSQEILRSWLGREVTTFVPPGNVFGETTLQAAADVGIRTVSCNTPPRRWGPIAVVGNQRVRDFHDRDVVLGGVAWLEAEISRYRERELRFVHVRDLAEVA
jgi:polysaccharide deacetylase